MKKNYIWILLLVVVLALGAYALASKNKSVPQKEEVAACTMDALICPDGSGVGRSGPKCEFEACPSREPSYSGKLFQQGGDFFMAIPAAPDSVEEVTYSLPVKFSRVSNVLSDFVGKNVKVTGSFSTGNNFMVETIEEIKEVEITTGQIKTGETKTINGVRITLNRIVEDSRCPIDAMCIQAGKLTADVTLKSDTDQEKTMISDTAPKNFDSFKISIIGSVPSKMASAPVKLEDLKVIFKVEKL